MYKDDTTNFINTQHVEDAMIDTKELRRLAQAATQHVGRACNYQDAHSPREGHVDFENADLFIASERPEEDAAFYAAASPAAISELLDRLDAAEKERDDLRAKVSDLTIGIEYLSNLKKSYEELIGELQDERDALRAEVIHWKEQKEPGAAGWRALARILQAKIETMEKQEPVGEIQRANSTGNYINPVVWVPMAVGAKLYAGSGAKGE